MVKVGPGVVLVINVLGPIVAPPFLALMIKPEERLAPNNGLANLNSADLPPETMGELF